MGDPDSKQAEAPAVTEGTSLLLTTASATASSSSINSVSITTASTKLEHARRILLSTTLSRLGSRSWEFATPLLLLEWSPNSLAAPATLGLTCALFRTIVSPWLGSMADGWENRLHIVLFGLGMQGLGCAASIGALMLWMGQYCHYAVSLTLVIGAGVIETLGAQLASVAVKKEWVPIVFNDKDDEDDANEKQQGSRFFFCRIPVINLSFINTTMTNIDLLAAMFGPVVAGWILEVLAGTAGDDGDANLTTHSMAPGFAVIAFVNVISFVPEALLLQRVYRSCPALQQKRPRHDTNSDTKQSGHETHNEHNHNHHSKENETNPWSIWFHHPSGLPLLTISLASLYLTALSPAGVVLTAYLVTIGLSPTALGIFRALGALSGVLGISLFSFFRKDGTESDQGEEDEAARSASVRSIERLREVSLAFLLSEVASILVAAVAFALCQRSSSFTPQINNDDNEQQPLSWQVILFLGALIVSRAGLYSFDVGALEIEQYIVDERHRNAVGSIEGALCSLAEMGMYVLSIVLPNPSDFGWQVGVSAAAVSCGGVCFGLFRSMYLMHGHHHCYRMEKEGECDDHDHHDHGHDHHHYHSHAHTWQQERDLEEYGYHIHLHKHF
eukprot:CAMPEP_0183719406 /NCGR_PEP_ID=MMETSP0737-20130205/12360_1 /TAXON_ID=385413 /ORGANISM="Thalassiosira miniscula, Strain CCMP1093" /LENGTH=614 /DNA_ID=CAMNT_0025949123 /DNA_START=263 /DNA_END=2107 /DNA_ORIENTATION=+